MDCTICGSNDITVITDFGEVPLCDNFSEDQRTAIETPRFPIKIIQCNKCTHSELTVKPPEELIYSNYTYRTSLSPLLDKHFDGYARKIKETAPSLTPDHSQNFLDIGGNDGVLAKKMLNYGYKTFVADPSPTSKFCDGEINLINTYFTSEVAKRLVESQGKMDIVSCNNCIANIRNLHGFAEAISIALKDDGYVFIETGYIHEQIKSKTAEMLNHEHYHYFSIKSMAYLFEQYGIKIVDHEMIQTKGGSFRFIGKKSKEDNNKIINEEGIENEAFNKYICSRKKVIRELAEQDSIAFFGSSAGSTILAYLFGINDKINYIVDDNETRHGFFMPGNGAQVISPKEWYSKKGKTCINLAWRFGDMIRAKHEKELPHNYSIEDIIK